MDCGASYGWQYNPTGHSARPRIGSLTGVSAGARQNRIGLVGTRTWYHEEDPLQVHSSSFLCGYAGCGEPRCYLSKHRHDEFSLWQIRCIGPSQVALHFDSLPGRPVSRLQPVENHPSCGWLLDCSRCFLSAADQLAQAVARWKAVVSSAVAAGLSGPALLRCEKSS